jgi:hypothetical protein
VTVETKWEGILLPNSLRSLNVSYIDTSIHTCNTP